MTGRRSRPPGGRLLVVATPLGNLGDMTARGVEALRSADLVACEDTRRTRPLLTHFGARAPAVSYHKFNEASRLREILAALASGRTVALVTDAGTPGVSDPGARLVAAARRAGASVEAIPGASAPAAAVSISGFEAEGFLFAGYPPPKKEARRRFFRALGEAERARRAADPAGAPWPIVLFEAPHRIAASLLDLEAELGDRGMVLFREMTKLHEEAIQGSVSEIRGAVGQGRRRGEFTLVVEGGAGPARGESGAAGRGGSPADLKAAYESLIAAGAGRKEALRRLARESGLRRRDLYARLMGKGPPGEEE